MRKIHLLLLLVLCTVLIRCKDSDVNPRNAPKLNITDATSLVVYDNNANNGRVATNLNNFYKVTTDGSYEEVKFVNSDNSEVKPGSTYIEISSIHNVDQNHIILEGYFAAWDTLGKPATYYTLLVRKTDGAIFGFGQEALNINSPCQLDDEGNAYFKNLYIIAKLKLSDNSMTYTPNYLYSGQKAEYFGIDKDGNCIYKDQTSTSVRIRKNNGGLFEMTGPGVEKFWIGANGRIYYYQYYSYDGPHNICSVINDNGTIRQDTVLSNAPEQFSGTKFFGEGGSLSSKYFVVKKTNSVVFINLDEITHFEFFENTNTLKSFELPPLSNTAQIVYSKKYYYIADGTKLYKVSLDDHSYSSLIAEGQYQVYTMTVGDDDVLQFSALRYSDGKKILAQIDNNGVFTTLEEEKDQPITSLQRIN